ncbi:MAG: tol-pal system-associated acyl-CoA thioesterase [Paracoccaceae bacterium]
MSRFQVRVYYEDTDLGGIVYHANYLRYLERGRTEALRALGVGQSRLKAETGLAFVVTRMEIAFRAPARLDDLLEVETAGGRLGAASLELRQSIRRGDDAIVEAALRLALIGRDGRPERFPKVLRAQMAGLCED